MTGDLGSALMYVCVCVWMVCQWLYTCAWLHFFCTFSIYDLINISSFFLSCNPFKSSRFMLDNLPIKLLQMPVSCLIVRVIVLCYQIKIVLHSNGNEVRAHNGNGGCLFVCWLLCIGTLICSSGLWFVRSFTSLYIMRCVLVCVCCLSHLEFSLFTITVAVSLCRHFQMIIAKSFSKRWGIFAVLYCC